MGEWGNEIHYKTWIELVREDTEVTIFMKEVLYLNRAKQTNMKHESIQEFE